MRTPKPSITTDFTPGQTLAMLIMRRSDLSNAVIAKLGMGTARPVRADFIELIALGYARRKADGYHQLSPRGHFKANALAQALAVQLEIKVPVTSYQSRGSFQRSIYVSQSTW